MKPKLVKRTLFVNKVTYVLPSLIGEGVYSNNTFLDSLSSMMVFTETLRSWFCSISNKIKHTGSKQISISSFALQHTLSYCLDSNSCFVTWLSHFCSLNFWITFSSSFLPSSSPSSSDTLFTHISSE